MRDFDAVTYNIGDKVRRKYKEDDASDKTIRDTKMIENLDGLRYQIIYFEGDTSFYVAYEFEPANSKDREAYYQHWSNVKSIKKKTTKKKKVVEKPSFDFTSITNKNKDDEKI